MEREQKLEITLALIQAVLTHGPAIVGMIQAMDAGHEPTLADFEALRDRVPPPESYE